MQIDFYNLFENSKKRELVLHQMATFGEQERVQEESERDVPQYVQWYALVSFHGPLRQPQSWDKTERCRPTQV